MSAAHTEVARALERAGWMVIDGQGCRLSSCPPRHLSGPPIGVTRPYWQSSGFVADVKGYTVILWHGVNAPPGRGREEPLERPCDALRDGDEELAKLLAKICS